MSAKPIRRGKIAVHRCCLSCGLLFMPLLMILGCGGAAVEKSMPAKPDRDVTQRTRTARMPWLDEPAARWQRDFSGSPRDGLIAIPQTPLQKEDIGSKTRVHDLFDRWTIKEEIRGDRGRHYVDITAECKGNIELDFALTAEEWANPHRRKQYYRAVDRLIEEIGQALLVDFGDQLQDQERELFLRALRTLAWQESKWQHYLRHEDWFFVIVSGGSYNTLDDWGITQIARSSFDPEVLLNQNFFESRGYCSISSSLYYGFMEYYFCYLEARENPDNGTSLFNRLMGAYNRYCSGYSSSCFELAEDDQAYRNYQIRAMGGFKDKFILTPWDEFMDLEIETLPPR